MAPEIKESAADVAQSSTDNDSETIAAQQEAFQRLLKLPLSQIKKLPQEQQDLLWQESLRETLRQVVEESGFIDGINTAIETLKNELGAIDPTAIEPIKKFLETLLSDNTRQIFQTVVTLAPYMKAEITEHPEKYDEQTGAHELIAAAARRAREDGKDIPFLKAEEPEPEQLQLDFPEGKEADPNKEVSGSARNKRTAAADAGALTTIGQRLLVPSDPDFQNAFVSSIKADIGIFIIEKLTDLELRDNGMQLSFIDNGISDLIDANERTGAKPLKDADTGFLRAMAKAAYKTRLYSDSMITRFSLPAFCEEIEITGEHGKDKHGKEIGSRAAAREREVLGRIESMNNVWGKLGSGQWWKVFSIVGFDRNTEIVTVAMPYFNQLLAEIERKQKRQAEAGKKYYIGFCDLLHASAANERNQAAVELAARVLIGVQQRGGTPDKRLKHNKHKTIKDETVCTWRITCAGLINNCPPMQEKLDAQKTTDGRNKAMQRAFSAMYRILREKSDLFAYYSNAYIHEVMPTTRTLTAEIYIQHHGLNPRYQRPVVIDATPEAEPAPTEND